MNILRIGIFNEIAVSSDDSLRTGLEPPEGLRHGVPVKGLHQLHDLCDQVGCSVVRLCTDPKLKDATHKIVQRFTVRRAGRPDLLLPHVRETLLESFQCRLTCLGHELTCFHTLLTA
jgi:hypothetical protein